VSIFLRTEPSSLAESLRQHLDGSTAPARIHELVSADVGRAARLIDTGLHSFALAPPADPKHRTRPAAARGPARAARKTAP
jgi:hypothetical protein